MNYATELRQRLALALNAKGKHYKPRTRHVKNGAPIFINRLILEDSPYLLQHAHNPVDWFPWGEEAFAKAGLENKPVFLSIGYATCHWCHVMEEDSFENLDVARLLNEHFVAIKVDREQYPDVDQIYMTAVNLFTGQGGWPMSSFLTDKGKPFFCGTYYPSALFIDLLLKIKQGWNTQHQAIIDQAQHLSDAVRQATSTQQQLGRLQTNAVAAAIDSILKQYDRDFGGFSSAPKFPNEPILLLLLQVLEQQPGQRISAALMHTLSAMAQGGIYDQIGGGFHRYAVDEKWLIPHFEKMLYNQAYLSRVYTRAYRLTGNPLFARIARQILDYVLREMTTSEGAFFSATDADSEGREGSFFVWSEAEINTLLGAGDGQLIRQIFGITRQGNFEGKNILYLPVALDEIARQQDVTLEMLLQRIDPLLQKLRNHRKQRIPPLTDDKVIVAWNGMLITALAEAGMVLADSEYMQAAEKAADFLWRVQRPEKNLLWRVFLDGKSSIAARQEDYVHFIEALIVLYDASDAPIRLKQASELCREMLEKFRDETTATLVMGRDELLFAHPHDSYDGALPSGNAVAVRVLSRLYRRTGDKTYLDHAENIIRAFSTGIAKQPVAYAYMLAQMDEMAQGETGLRQYAAKGAVKIKAVATRINDEVLLQLDLALAEGWCIRAQTVDDDVRQVLAVSLLQESDWELEEVVYPQPEQLGLDFESEPRAGYQGEIQMICRCMPKTEQAVYPLKLMLQLQACNEQICLTKEAVTLAFYATDCP